MESDLFASRSPFGDLERKRRETFLFSITRFLFYVTGPIVVTFIILFAVAPAWQSLVPIILSSLFVLISLLARRMSRQGQSERGGFLLIAYFFLMAGSNGILIDGFFPAVAPVFAAVIVMSGMIIGPAGTFYMSILGSITWLAAWGIVAAKLITPISTSGVILPILIGGIVVITFQLVAFMSNLATSDLRQALNDATYDLNKINKELKRANMLKSQFMARTSHELRTPLNAIIGFSDLTLRKIYGPLTQFQEDGLSRVLINGKRLLALINDILDLSKIEAGELTLNETAFPINNIVQIVDMTLAKKAQDKELGLSISVAPDFPPQIVADENRLAQILLNLTDNAIKFTEKGNVAISIESPIDGRWSIVVRDTGRGIREEDRDRIFEEFYQLDYTVTEPKSHGTGLGLAITRHLAEKMKGEIHLDSQIGKGSEFKVTLPLKLPEKQEVADLKTRPTT